MKEGWELIYTCGEQPLDFLIDKSLKLILIFFGRTILSLNFKGQLFNSFGTSTTPLKLISFKKTSLPISIPQRLFN